MTHIWCRIHILRLSFLLLGERWVPDSCCRPLYNESFGLVEGSGYEYPSSINCSKSNNPALWWSHGCLDAIQMWVLHRLHVVGAVGLVIAFIQVLFMSFSHCRQENKYFSITVVWSINVDAIILYNETQEKRRRNVQILFTDNRQQSTKSINK